MEVNDIPHKRVGVSIVLLFVMPALTALMGCSGPLSTTPDPHIDFEMIDENSNYLNIKWDRYGSNKPITLEMRTNHSTWMELTQGDYDNYHHSIYQPGIYEYRIRYTDSGVWHTTTPHSITNSLEVVHIGPNSRNGDIAFYINATGTNVTLTEEINNTRTIYTINSPFVALYNREAGDYVYTITSKRLSLQPISIAHIDVSIDNITSKYNITINDTIFEFTSIHPGLYYYYSGGGGYKYTVIEKPFHILVNEVTVKQWNSVVNDSISEPFNDLDAPITSILTTEMYHFIDGINWHLSSKNISFYGDFPTEHQWGYAADANVNINLLIDTNRFTSMHIVGQGINTEAQHVMSMAPNRWGLFDMYGNVGEVCRNNTNNNTILICGGSFINGITYFHSYTPLHYTAPSEMVGFRIILNEIR